MIPRKEDADLAVLSFTQERLWFLDQLEPNSAAYNIPLQLRLRGAFNKPALQRSLNEILRRHESLRTRFEFVEGQSLQVIQPASSLEMALVDLTGLPKVEREAEANRLCFEEARRPFDFTCDILLRARLFRLDQADYVLFLNIHHIASDEWSVGLLLGELSNLYQAFIEGRPSPLPELQIQYVDFAVWHRKWLHEVLEEQLDYWRNQLDGAPAVLELPTDHTRPAVQSYRGALLSSELPQPLLVALKGLSRQAGATLFMTLFAGFQTLLHRYTGSDDILVGTPIAGRNWTETEPLIGLFINTLVLRGDLSNNPSFRTFLGRTRATALGAYSHQELPFERLIADLKLERNLNISPLFQVMFVFQNASREAVKLADLEVARVPIHTGTSKFDLTFMISEHGSRLFVVAEYNTELFEADTIRRMLGHYQTLLEGAVADVDRPLSEIPMLASGERQQILLEWNNTQHGYPQNKFIHELFEEQVERTPDAVALVFEESSLTYRELDRRSDALARQLRLLGVGPNVLVALFLDRSPDMVIGMLSVLKSGGAYVPLDPNHPSMRLAYMLADAAPLILLTQESLQSKLPTHRAHIVLIDADAAPPVQPHHAAHIEASRPRDLAYVIYTSGSTGEPKGVEIEHRAVVNMLASMQRCPGLGAGDTMLAITTLSFDIAVLEIFLPLVCGASVVIAPSQTVGDGAALADLIKHHDISVMQATPATWRLLLDAGWEGTPHLKILCGGEAWTTELADQLLTRCGSGSLWNMYGPTETTVWSAVAKVESGGRVVIGAPIANTQFYISDRHLQPMPIGVPGELHIGGFGLARGYHNRAELTAEKFIVDPFHQEPDTRLYRTGDLARYMPDGTIEYLGRMDDQVKIRGFRVELGEIETNLAGLPGIAQAVVVAREDVSGFKRLVAYVTVNDTDTPKEADLRRQLQATLPEYMVPSAFVVMDQLPLTPNGKVDRRALPAPENQIDTNKRSAAPRTDLEKALCAIWCKYLELSMVGIRDNFFDLGGYSLLSARVVGDINKTFHTRLNIPIFFDNPTIELLARVIQDAQNIKSEHQVVPWQTGTKGLPLYFIGAGLPEHRIARLTGADRRIFAVDIRMPTEWLKLDRTTLPTVQQLGKVYGDMVREHVGSSPCVIVGCYFPARIAFEAAHVLRAAGGNIALVLLVDASVWSGGVRSGPALQSCRWVWRMATERKEVPLVFRIGAFLHDSWRLFRWILALLPGIFRHRLAGSRLSASKSGPSADLDTEGNFVDRGVAGNFRRIVGESFHPRPLDASGVLIRPDNPGENLLPGHDITNGWCQLFTRGLEVIQAKGDHVTMVTDENAESFARLINEVLDRYDRGEEKPVAL
jgi:amino acid adenylation domain-containing protein